MSRVVLVIEDSVQNRYLTTFLLEHHGYRVVPAVDGAHGLEVVRTMVPDVILLDIQLPGMDGYAVAQALRQIPAIAHVPIIAVTSYAMVGDREKSLAAGCDGYLEKPIDPETFVSDMERLVSRKGFDV